jgi:hypothetical protein
MKKKKKKIFRREKEPSFFFVGFPPRLRSSTPSPIVYLFVSFLPFFYLKQGEWIDRKKEEEGVFCLFLLQKMNRFHRIKTPNPPSE